MPSDKKRINLTVPDNIYEQLQAYKEEHGIMNDASACLQLIVRQLKSMEAEKAFIKIIRDTPKEQLMELSDIGLTAAQEELKKLPK